MKPGPIIAILIIAGAMAYGAMAFKTGMNPYLPFDQAKTASAAGNNVQIMGKLVPGATRFDHDTGTLDFALAEPKTGTVMPVVFKQPKPDNFDRALSVTAIGKYDTSKKLFVADNLLVKCPSKYDDGNAVDRSYKAGS